MAGGNAGEQATRAGLPSSPKASDEVEIIGDAREDTMGLFNPVLVRGKLPASTLKEHLQQFLNAMKEVFSTLPTYVGSYQLDSLTLSVEVSAKGTVSLLGTGGEAGGKGGMTFTFKRKPAESGQQGTAPPSLPTPGGAAKG